MKANQILVWVMGTFLWIAPAFGEGFIDVTLQSHNVVLVDLQKNSQEVWIPYVGELSGVCGFKVLPATAYNVSAQALAEVLVVEDRGASVIHALEHPHDMAEVTLAKKGDLQSFGAAVQLKTKSGETFFDVVHKIISEVTMMPETVSHGLVIAPKMCQ